MYSKIIVPLDGSALAEQSLPYARLIAGSLAVPIELLEAFDVLPPAVHGPSTTYARNRMMAEMRRRTRQYLGNTQDELAGAGYVTSSTALPGVPSQAIVRHVSADPDALVVMSSHGRGGIARWALGSIADKVLNSVPNPILIIRSVAEQKGDEVDFQTVVVPLDGSELAELSLPHAVPIARACGSRIALLSVTHSPDYYRRHMVRPLVGLTPMSGAARESANQRAKEDLDAANDYLARVQRRLAEDQLGVGEIDTRHVQHDDIAQSIIDHAEPGHSLVVMTTHGRRGLGRALMGSVTDRVVRHSTGPVLVVRNR